MPLLLVACQMGATVGPLQGQLAHVEPAIFPEPVFLLEDPGTIIVSEPDTRICGESVGESVVETPGGFVAVALPRSFELPSYADKATVFLNGWSARYLQDDHHVRSLAAVIRNIELDGNTLNWLAVGWIWDDNGDDAYEFCYTFTVLGWNSSAIDVEVDHDNNRVEVNGVETDFYNGTFRDSVSALTSISSFADVPLSSRPPVPKEAAAILPRGFRFEFEEDHHQLQLAYSLDHNAFFVEAGNEYDFLGPLDSTDDAHRVHPFTTSWETHGILKDNAVSRGYFFLSEPTVVVGNDISAVRPPFTVLPLHHIDANAVIGCAPSVAPEGERREDVEIRDVPFEYAVPVLSGWDLSYPCDDEHVTEVGIWLENINYDKDPADPTGTLSYTVASVLRDKDFDPSHNVRHKVDILGLNGREPADLIPIPHAADVDFCNRDQEGRLVVGISNIADAPAPASTTHITFNPGGTVELDTPGIPGNFSGDLEPLELPEECAGGCLFTVRVDAFEQIAELEEGNNAAEGRCSV